MTKYNFQEIKDWGNQIHFYEHDAWMGEYDINLVGRYLQQFDRFSSGERNWFEARSEDMFGSYYPSRADFIKWAYKESK